MANITPLQFKQRALDGKNDQTWVGDCEFHLAAMQLSHTISPRVVGVEIPPHEVAKASIFIRHHIHPDLKMEYLEVRDSLALWSALHERFGKQKAIMLPQARRDWGQLRFLDFKTVGEYNTALHRIVGQLRFCGQKVTESEMIDKTLETFHPSNMVLQQQYRKNKYKKYSELIQVLLAAETQNDILMKNFHMRPVGSQAVPEAHATFRNGKGKAPFRNKGQQRGGKQGPHGGNFKKQAYKGSKPNGHGKAQKGHKGNANENKHPNQGCFRCGSMKHWSRTCTTEPHLIQMYQEWKKRQNPEAHFVQVPVATETGAQLRVPTLPTETPELDGMEVDPVATTKTTAEGDDGDFDLDEDDLLGEEAQDME